MIVLAALIALMGFWLACSRQMKTANQWTSLLRGKGLEDATTRYTACTGEVV